ncbi:DNA-binding transcriptional ArsR family regulator [Arthrobacter sp. CAN_A214]|uniref:ArsR/SmtB family transcription factor n=1 Tax=Arthrobacter sp. CAN_A214 TaxID=2787720 RepID=UPI0018CB2DCA
MTTVTLAHAAALTRLGNALSEGIRTQILLALRSAPARPSELAQTLGVSKQVKSNQLACLRGCGLVEATRQGRSTWYRLTGPRLGEALGDLLELMMVVEPDCCSPEGCTCT